MSTRGFVPGCSNTACPFRQHSSSKGEQESCLFCSGWYNGQTGEGGRLADRALIRASRGFDK